VTKNMTETLKDHETIGVDTNEKCPEMSQFMENNDLSQTHTVLNNVPFQETSDIQSFQGVDNDSISSVLTERGMFKRRKGPSYRIINRNLKSKTQYWKERNRRKQVWKLNGEGLTYPQIAKKLGVSAKTVQRDMKKVFPYHKGILLKQLRELEEKRYRKFEKMLDGMTLIQRFKTLTNMIIKQRKQKRGREYRRHLVKLFINMDNCSEVEGVPIPRITHWPKAKHSSVVMPFHLKFFVVIKGCPIPMGGLDVG